LSDLTALKSVPELLPDRWQKSPTPPTELAALLADRKQGYTDFTSTQLHKTLSAKKEKF